MCAWWWQMGMLSAVSGEATRGVTGHTAWPVFNKPAMVPCAVAALQLPRWSTSWRGPTPRQLSEQRAATAALTGGAWARPAMSFPRAFQAARVSLHPVRAYLHCPCAPTPSNCDCNSLCCASCSFGADTMAYAYAVGVGGQPSCADAAVSTLREMLEKGASYG